MTAAPVTPIVVPLWLGTERHGTDLGATALHRTLRAIWTPERVGDRHHARLGAAVPIACPVPADAERHIDHRTLAFRDPILQTAREHAAAVRDAIGAGTLALSIGGDHALAFGSLAGAAWADPRVGVIWIDTHPDLNTPCSSPSGHMHGMPLATAIGIEGHALPELEGLVGRSPLVAPANVALLGVRDIDAGERSIILRDRIWALTMEEWHDTGITRGLEQALGHLMARGVTSVHVSLDLDVIDPSVLPGTGTKAPGGLSYREASQVVRRLGEWDGPVRSLDIVELNPRLDPTGHSTRIAGMLLATALGMRQLPPRD
jgi:arginase